MVSGTVNRRLLPLALVTGLTLLALDASGFGPIVGVRRSVLVVAGPVRSGLGALASPVVATWHGAVHYDDVVEENDRLRVRLAEAEGRLAGQPDLRAELRSLSEAVDIAGLDGIDRVTARVVADRRSAIERVVELDKGRDHGLAPGMPVVTGAGLVGVVDEVVARRSVIRLVTDTELAVGVRSRHGLGLIIGRADGSIELQPGPDLAAAIAEGRIEDGHRLVTSGLERSRFPAGVAVARVTADGEPAGDGSLPIEPAADLDWLGYLTVLLVDRPA